MITVITPTADRPQGIVHLAEYLERQTVQPTEWIIVDDGNEATPIPSPPWCRMIKLKRQYEGSRSLANNLITGLDAANPEHAIVICEDDDWYSPKHMEVSLRYLERYPATGCQYLQYYHITNRSYRKMSNTGAALCQTALNPDMVESLRQSALATLQNGDRNIDGTFWKSAPRQGLHNTQTVIGIKGIAGRKGIGIGHRPDRRWAHDPQGRVLRDWIGDDVERYL